MNKFNLCLIILLSSFTITNAQIDKVFPDLKGETLAKKTMLIPQDLRGKFSIVGLAHSQKAESDLQTWFQPVFTTFIEKPKPGLFNESYDVNIFFIPMFTGVNQAGAEKAHKFLNEKLDKNLVPHVIIYKGELSKYKDFLNLSENDIPYFFVLDDKGKIIHFTSGKYTDEKMEKIESFLE